MLKLLEIHRKNINCSSNNKLAGALLAKYKELDWGSENVKSLATRLGYIDNGKTSWWLRRPTLVQALAEHLDVSPEDLGLHPELASDTFRFTEFPELSPLDLVRERPCDLGMPVSLGGRYSHEEMDLWLGQSSVSITVKQPPSGVYWLHFLPGRGVDLFWTHLQRHSKYETLSANTIQDARESLKQPRHLILRIDAKGGDSDLHALASMHKDMALLVVAPYTAPSCPKPGDIRTLYLWERLNASRETRRELDLMTEPSEIRSFEWRLHSDWIERLVLWIEKRLDTHQTDTHFTANEILKWLGKFPYLQRLLDGPGDLLHLCSLLHKLPSRKWPKEGSREAGRVLLRHILPGSERAQNDYSDISIVAWRNNAVDWATPLTLTSWESLAAAPTGLAQEKLNALIESDDRAVREKIARQLKNPASHIDLIRLQELQLLAAESGEGYSLRPKFMPSLLARDHVIESMTKGPLESWALHCFDPRRRLVVDAALDALMLDDLIGIAKMLPQSLAGDAAGIAAAEALFYAIARKAKEKGFNSELLTIAPRLLIQLAEDNASELPCPWSRETNEESAQLEWIATCWAWSLLETPNSLPTRLQNSWLFPRWANDLSSAEDWELLERLIDDKAKLSDPGVHLVLQRAGEWVDRMEQPPAAPPSLLKPLLIAEGAKRGWSLEPDWWHGIFDARWKEELLANLVREMPQEFLPRLLGSLIDHVADTFQTKRSAYEHFLLSPLLREILIKLPSGELATVFTKEQIRLLLSTPEALPPALRREALELLLSAGTQDPIKIAKLIHLSTESDALLPWLETAYWRIAAQKIWQLTPHRAKSILGNTEKERPLRIHALLLTCPDLSYSLPLIREHSPLFQQQELKALARERLPNAGLHSQELMKLLIQTGVDRGAPAAP